MWGRGWGVGSRVFRGWEWKTSPLIVIVPLSYDEQVCLAGNAFLLEKRRQVLHCVVLANMGVVALMRG